MRYVDTSQIFTMMMRGSVPGLRVPVKVTVDCTVSEDGTVSDLRFMPGRGFPKYGQIVDGYRRTHLEHMGLRIRHELHQLKGEK